jgi:hypothetical protein
MSIAPLTDARPVSLAALPHAGGPLERVGSD